MIKKYFDDNAQTTCTSSEHEQNICKVPKDRNRIVGVALTNTLVNVYVDLVVFTRIAGTS